MNGSDEQFARKITALLDQAAAQVSDGVAYRLQQARARALDGEPGSVAEPAFAHSLAAAGGVLRTPRSAGRPWWAQWKLWVGIVAIVTAALGWQQWQTYRQVQTYEDLDAQILSSDLPIDAYLDRGFDAWLKTSSKN
ncbi:MAG: DUF3619 family protein [Casimicrobiaceae bacterium]